LRLTIVHHHFRPGGVRRVIETATPHVLEHWPERVSAVVLATGEAPDPDWLKRFRARLTGTPVKVVVQPAFGYLSELSVHGSRLVKLVVKSVLQLLPGAKDEEVLIWAHNLGLGRNLFLARELTFTCHCARIRLLMHHHDWWFENRWHHLALPERGFRKLPAVANAVLAASPMISHLAINQADAKVLEKHFPGLSGWLPDLVEPEAPPSAERVEAAQGWLRQQIGEAAPVWLLPCRLLRRKNLAEALLLTRWLRPGAWLVTTGGVSSADEQPYANALADAARAHHWPLHLGVFRGEERAKPSVQELLAASEAIVLTSLQEGFGLPYLEAAAARRPLVARQLPNIAPDLKKFGFTFPQYYREVLVDPGLFNWPREQKRQTRGFAEWKSSMPGSAGKFVGKPTLLAAGNKPAPVPFSRLTLTAQLEVLAQPVDQSWERCLPLNPFLKNWREQAAAGQLKPSPWPRSANRWLGGQAYARKLLDLVPRWGGHAPNPGASQAAQTAFFRLKLRSENLYPILWNSRP
jgi:glycosyltransferase involved in cell wall biosynthesis